MARTSDTRTLTREAAAQMAADGRPPHTLTVDQIYEVIRQGSRTTINDELKRWKAERAQADALADTLPPAIAEAMRGLWAAAVERGTEQFATERDVLIQGREAALATCQQQAEALSEAQSQHDSLTEQVAMLTAALDVAQREHARLDAARAAAAAEAATLRETLDQVRQESTRERAEARAAQEALVTSHQAASAERDQAFRQEIDRATERLQQMEARMLKQIDDARTAARRSEAQWTKAQEQNTVLRTELAELRQRASRDQRDLASAREAVAAAQARQVDAERLSAERERALITTTAQAEAAQRVIGTLEAALQRGRRGRTTPATAPTPAG